MINLIANCLEMFRHKLISKWLLFTSYNLQVFFPHIQINLTFIYYCESINRKLYIYIHKIWRSWSEKLAEIWDREKVSHLEFLKLLILYTPLFQVFSKSKMQKRFRFHCISKFHKNLSPIKNINVNYFNTCIKQMHI